MVLDEQKVGVLLHKLFHHDLCFRLFFGFRLSFPRLLSRCAWSFPCRHACRLGSYASFSSFFCLVIVHALRQNGIWRTEAQLAQKPRIAVLRQDLVADGSHEAMQVLAQVLVIILGFFRLRIVFHILGHVEVRHAATVSFLKGNLQVLCGGSLELCECCHRLCLCSPILIVDLLFHSPFDSLCTSPIVFFYVALEESLSAQWYGRPVLVALLYFVD
mmetsp:Transcript_79317/g.150638  ORF Transcript_79317/g.150638 Transcript_79317/m.150638 type:complete len:216 (-) Transcript_79317:838-1485(-)